MAQARKMQEKNAGKKWEESRWRSVAFWEKFRKHFDHVTAMGQKGRRRRKASCIMHHAPDVARGTDGEPSSGIIQRES